MPTEAEPAQPEEAVFPLRPIAEAPLDVVIETVGWPFGRKTGWEIGRHVECRGSLENGVVVWRSKDGTEEHPEFWMHVGEKERLLGENHPAVRSWNEELECW